MDAALSTPATLPITLTVSPGMVQQFAELTGDVSPLHTDPAFGRRSPYGQNVAHGMLPVMALALSAGIRRPGFQAYLTRLAASFQAPVHLDDRIVLALQPSKPDNTTKEHEASFRIERADSSLVLTQGTVAWRYRPSPDRRDAAISGDGEATSASMVTHKIEVQDLAFTRIKKGSQAGFDARIHSQHQAAVLALLRQAIGDDGKDVDFVDCTPDRVDLRPFLTAALCSTMVGVCLPGKTATFLSFSLEYPDSEDAWSEPVRLGAEVSFSSPSTRTIIEQLNIRAQSGNGPVLATGKLQVRVNNPPSTMPSLQDLATQRLDPGLKDKVVLITGASRGLGETTAKLFSLHGCRVVINYHRSGDDAASIVREIQANGGAALAVRADVANPAEVTRMIAEIVESFGPVEVLVNNAVGSLAPVDFLHLTWDRFQRDLDVILRGAFHCCQAVLPGMVERKRGKIINIGTQATEVAPPRQASYVVAKSGLVGLTRSLAAEFAAFNVQINMVCPGMVDTDLTAGISPLVRQRVISETPMNRLVQPAEVASAVVMLASDLASFTTGQQFMVTGGLPPSL